MHTESASHDHETKNGKSAADVKLEDGWKKGLLGELASERMQTLKAFLQQRMKAGKKIYPKPEDWFAALNLTPFAEVKVVIVGQDPYHGPGQAHGLSFSVRDGMPFPPSLLNIFKEMHDDTGIAMPPKGHGCLEPWAKQGVLLLNAVLTVEEGHANAHEGKGWEQFTDRIIHLVNEEKENVVFLLWGAYAQKKAAFVDPKKHLVIKAPHPSPLSAHRGFFGSKPFSKINAYLKSKGLREIDWRVDMNE